MNCTATYYLLHSEHTAKHCWDPVWLPAREDYNLMYDSFLLFVLLLSAFVSLESNWLSFSLGGLVSASLYKI